MVWGQWFEGPRLTKRNVYNGLGTHGSPNLTNTLIWWPIAHQALHIQLCGYALLTKPYKYTGGGSLGNGTGMVRLLSRPRPPLHRLRKHGKPVKLWKKLKHGKLSKHVKPMSPLTKPYKYYGLTAHGSPNAMYTNGFANIDHQTIQIQLLDCLWFTKHYVYHGLGTYGAPNVTNTMVWWSAAHHTLRIQWFGYTWLTTHYKDMNLKIHGSPNVTYTIVFVHMAHQTV